MNQTHPKSYFASIFCYIFSAQENFFQTQFFSNKIPFKNREYFFSNNNGLHTRNIIFALCLSIQEKKEVLWVLPMAFAFLEKCCLFQVIIFKEIEREIISLAFNEQFLQKILFSCDPRILKSPIFVLTETRVCLWFFQNINCWHSSGLSSLLVH